MTDKPTIYLVTAYRHNHLDRGVPVDRRFTESDRNFQFYFVDPQGAPPGLENRGIAEMDLDPSLQIPGKRQLAEWTFFFAEHRHRFASYPFYVISTRFYEKNERMVGTLDDYWDDAFRHLNDYGFGYLPSYNRDFGFEDLDSYFLNNYLAITLENVHLVKKLYGFDVLNHRYMSDFYCNYIGFRSREEFEAYFEFFRPIFDVFFDEQLNEKIDASAYIQALNALQQQGFRNEKPLSLLLELVSHLPFVLWDRPFVGLSYDGFYEVDERRLNGRLIQPAGESLRPRETGLVGGLRPRATGLVGGLRG